MPDLTAVSQAFNRWAGVMGEAMDTTTQLLEHGNLEDALKYVDLMTERTINLNRIFRTAHHNMTEAKQS